MDSIAAKVIYHCFDGEPSLRAAAAHLRRPLVAPRSALDGLGRLHLVGRGQGGEEVYILARRGAGAIAERALHSVASSFGAPERALTLVDAERLRDPALAAKQGRNSLSVAAFPRPTPAGEVGPRVIYVCYGSAHSSIVAANLHLDRLPVTRRALPAELVAAPRFDQMPHREIGTLLEMGQDPEGHRVYALGLGRERDILGRAVVDLVTSLGLPSQSVLLVDALTGAHVTTRIGGFLSRRLGLVRVGRPLVASGILHDYDRFLALVQGVRQRLAKREFS
ncbi:MAG: DUF3189 family protein [Symbiobacteriia bacterium]